MFAQHRPKIGLVLSGGGARGAAHLGIIKAFEKHHIPIDAIVGTSMGAFVGGLYASGKSTDEIEKILTSIPWHKVIAHDYDRKKIPFRRKRLERDFPADAKLGIDSEGKTVLPTGVFKKHGMLHFLKKETDAVHTVTDFDKLNIPFWAVASRLKDGKRVVLKKGSLAESIYASLAIPGGFEPIEIDGDLLIDGGIADNLPVDVMREEMDVDYIVVVDISTPYDQNATYKDYISVIGQLVNILMRNNVESTLASMKGKKNEILITPNLKNYTPLDIEAYPQIIAIGEKTANAAFGNKLAFLEKRFAHRYPVRYANLSSRQSMHPKAAAPVIDRIEIINHTYLNETKIRRYLHIKEGERLDKKQLDADLAQLYSLMVFDDVTYRIEEKNGQHILKITAAPNWDVNGQMRFSFGFEDNLQGHNDYFAKAEYIKFGLNSYAGEWRSYIGIGKENLLSTELYQPLDASGYLYVRPKLFYRNEKVYVSPGILGDHSIHANLDDTLSIQAKEYGALLAAGINVSTTLRAEMEGTLKRVEPEVKLLSTGTDGTYFTNEHAKATLYQFKGVLEYDSLDDAFFPKEGMHLQGWIDYSKQYDSSKPGSSDLSYSQYYLAYTGALSIGEHTLITNASWGETFHIDGNFDDLQDFSSFFRLGGLFSLSGLPSNAITGNNVASASIIYRYRISKEDFFGKLSMPLYAGMSLETSAAWYGDGAFNRDRLLYAGSIYLAVDTLLGPFYLGFGTTDFDYYSLHLSLGNRFRIGGVQRLSFQREG